MGTWYFPGAHIFFITKPVSMAYSRSKSKYTPAPYYSSRGVSKYYDDRDDRPSLFDRVKFYQKPDLIKPTLHWLDESSVKSFVKDMFGDKNHLMQEAEKLKVSSAANVQALVPDSAKFVSKMATNFDKIPPHLIYDIFKMYYNKTTKLEFEQRTEKNKMRYKFLERSNDAVGKIMSESSHLKSAVFTRNIVMHYLMHMTLMDYIEPKSSDRMSSALNEEKQRKNSADKAQDAMDQMMNNPNFDKGLRDAIQNAQQVCQLLDENMDQDLQESIFKESDTAGPKKGGNGAGKVSLETLQDVKQRLEHIKMNMASVKEVIKKLLDKTFSYFSSRKETQYEDLFNSSDVSGLDEYVLLHPKVRKIFAEDILIPTHKPVGKINVYIDISGSMDSGCGLKNAQRREIDRLDFAKSIVAQLMESNMINKVFLFNNEVKEIKPNLISLSYVTTSGGTTINSVIKHINEVEKTHSLIITDAEDGCSTYSEQAYFIGVKGSKFTHFDDRTIKKYSENEQVIVFDGNKIYSVDQHGSTIR
jgi:hypothetical protein